MVLLKALVQSELLEFEIDQNSATCSLFAGIRLAPLSLNEKVTEITYFTEGNEARICSPQEQSQLLTLRGAFIRLLSHNYDLKTLLPQVSNARTRLGELQQDYRERCQRISGKIRELSQVIQANEQQINARKLQIDQTILKLRQDIQSEQLQKNEIAREKNAIDLQLKLALKDIKLQRRLGNTTETLLDQQAQKLNQEAKEAHEVPDAQMLACDNNISVLCESIASLKQSKLKSEAMELRDPVLLGIDKELATLDEKRQALRLQQQTLKEEGLPSDPELENLNASLENSSAAINATLTELLAARRDLSLDGVPDVTEITLSGSHIASEASIYCVDGHLSCPSKVSVGNETYHWVLKSRYTPGNVTNITGNCSF